MRLRTGNRRHFPTAYSAISLCDTTKNTDPAVDLGISRSYSGEKWASVGLSGASAPKKNMFKGSTNVTLDGKGRLAMPSKYRDRVAQQCGGHVVVTVDKSGCLLIYPQPDWDEVEAQINALPTLHEGARELQRNVVGAATELELDGAGRILLSRELRDFANLDKQTMLVGQGQKFELWDYERWQERQGAWVNSKAPDFSDLPPEMQKLSF
jgi:MraZ protein